VSVETVNKRLNRRLVQVAQVGRALAGLLAEHEGLGVDQAEGVNDDLALHGLNRIHDDGDSSRCQLLETLLRVDIDGGEPAAEARMGMVPANDGFRSAKQYC